MALLSLIARLGLDKTGFDQGIKSAQSRVDGFASNVKGALAGAFSAAAIGAFLKGVVDATGRIKDLSEQFGLTTREIQETDFALTQSGQQFEVLGSALTKLAQARRDAVEGNMELRESFARFGLTLQDLNDPQQRNYDLLRRIASAMSTMNMTAADQVGIIDLLGKGSIKLASTLQDLANFKPPALFTDDDINSIDRATKSFAALKLELQTGLAPAIGELLQSTTILLQSFKAFGAGETKSGQKPQATGIKGRFEAMALQFEEGMANAIIKPLLDPIGKGLKNLVFPQAEGQGGGLFQIDKAVKDKAESARMAPALGIPLPGADALGRIGAFSGGGQAEVAKQLKAHENILRDIRSALTDRGIKIKEL